MAPCSTTWATPTYQQGDLGRAIVSYEQAAQLTPRDPDLRQNLAQARSQAKVAAPRPAGVLGRLAAASSHWLTVNELALLALGAWFLLGFLVLVYRHFQPGRRPAALRYAAVVALLCVVITGVSLAGRVTSAPRHTYRNRRFSTCWRSGMMGARDQSEQ